MKLGNQRLFLAFFFITRQTRYEKCFLLEKPADKQGTQERNSVEFESLIY